MRIDASIAPAAWRAFAASTLATDLAPLRVWALGENTRARGRVRDVNEHADDAWARGAGGAALVHADGQKQSASLRKS